MVLSIDLNDLPAESRQLEESANPTDLQHEHPPSHSGSGPVTSPIDEDAIDDEVILLTASEWHTEARSQPRRKRPFTVVIDENLEPNTEHSGVAVEEPIATTLCPDCRSSGSLMNRTTSGSIIYTGDDDVPTINDARQTIHVAEREASPAADEPTLICPVCMCTLNEPASTTCGHVFCSSCIVNAIKRQKKCPTCRKKLTKKNFHRIYLPSN